jgi:hypothetical protein
VVLGLVAGGGLVMNGLLLHRKDSRFPITGWAAGASSGGQFRRACGRRAVPGFSSAACVAASR